MKKQQFKRARQIRKEIKSLKETIQYLTTEETLVGISEPKTHVFDLDNVFQKPVMNFILQQYRQRLSQLQAEFDAL